VFDHRRLLEAIKDDLKRCKEAARFKSTDEKANMRNNVEFSALMTHLLWTESITDNQTELGRIVKSLEGNPFLQAYPRWRSRCEKI